MNDLKSFLGLQWIAGEGIPQYQDPLPGGGEPYYAISSVQLQALIGMLELALAAKSVAIPSIDLSSWLVGFEAGSEASKKHLTANLDHSDKKSRVPHQCADTGLDIRDQSGTGHAPPLKSESSGSSEQALSETSDSSSGCADGESAGELPTPSRTDDALPLKHAASVTVFDAAENEVQS